MRKRALVVRFGAAGDCIISSALFPYLKRDGYDVHVLTGKNGLEIHGQNPNVDRLIPYTPNSVPIPELDGFYHDLSRDYDKTVVLVGSIENRFLFGFPQHEYYWIRPKLRRICDGKNYYLETIKAGGYEPTEIKTGQLYFSPEDISFARNFRRKFKDRFLIVLALSGSSLHKGYGYTEYLVDKVVKAIPEALFVVVGSEVDMMASFEHPNVVNFGRYNRPIMTSFALTKIADLVMGPETSVLNAAGCFDTPKICMLSHSGRDNLTSTWANDYSIQCASDCSPCHYLHTTKHIWRNRCQLDPNYLHQLKAEIPICAGMGFPPKVLFNRVMEIYSRK